MSSFIFSADCSPYAASGDLDLDLGRGEGPLFLFLVECGESDLDVERVLLWRMGDLDLDLEDDREYRECPRKGEGDLRRSGDGDLRCNGEGDRSLLLGAVDLNFSPDGFDGFMLFGGFLKRALDSLSTTRSAKEMRYWISVFRVPCGDCI